MTRQAYMHGDIETIEATICIFDGATAVAPKPVDGES